MCILTHCPFHVFVHEFESPGAYVHVGWVGFVDGVEIGGGSVSSPRLDALIRNWVIFPHSPMITHIMTKIQTILFEPRQVRTKHAFLSIQVGIAGIGAHCFHSLSLAYLFTHLSLCSYPLINIS